MPQQQRDDDPGDQQQDEVGLTQVAAYEPARPLDLSDHERRDDAGEHQHGEHIDEECIPALLPQPWQRRVLVDDPDHGDKDRRELQWR